MYDVIVIGAGVSGSATARELSRYDLKVGVLEKEEDVCCGTSKANSGIVHAGFDARPGSLMAKMNVRGNQMMEQLTEDLDIPFERNGSLVLCFAKDEMERLKKLKKQGEENGVKRLQILSGEEVRRMEPDLSKEVYAALYAPTGGIVCPFELNLALAENACQNGAEFYFDTAVEQIEKQSKARLAREWEVALPNELTLEQSKELVKGFAQSLVDEGMCVDVNIHWKEGNHHAHIMATVRAINEKGQWAPKTKKVYCRDVYGEKIPLIDKNTGLQKVDKQNRKQWKCYKDDYTDWNKREKVEEWRSRWAEHCNMALEKAQSIARVDHRSYAAQGIEELPTIHEGYIARKIEANGGISERCEINREIRGHNWLIRKCLYEIQLLTKQITDLTKQKGEEINERFANLFKRQNRSREDSKTERADPNRKRGVEGSELRSFIANLDSQRQTAEFDRQRSETERKNRDDEQIGRAHV